MIAATPVDGGHYFSDVIAGLVIAAACWIAVARFAAIQRNSDVGAPVATEAAVALNDAPPLVPSSGIAMLHDFDSTRERA
jgi:membrane-associated phospholipid phosphatase